MQDLSFSDHILLKVPETDASGTNHTLPTSGYAKAYSGVNLDSFIRKITFQEISRKGLQNLGNTIETMAANEMLDAHKNAVSVRLAEK